MRNRDFTVDVLKALGTLCVVLAHISPPEWLYHIRVFDVCMLVFASGLTLKYHGESIRDYIMYILKRFKRLVIPTWGFLAFYFGFSILMCQTYEQWSISLSDMIKSFTFTGGIDYIWIIRVYFLLAIVSPWIYKIANSELFQKNWMLFLLCLLCANEALGCVSLRIDNEQIRKLFQAVCVYTLGYAIVEIVACLSKRIGIPKLLVASTIAFFACWFSLGMISPQYEKYPPGALYLLYGAMISLGICWLTSNGGDCPIWLKHAIEWISDNSLLIYFFHIIPVTFIFKMGYEWIPFGVKYVVVLSLSCACTGICIVLKTKSTKMQKS